MAAAQNATRNFHEMLSQGLYVDISRDADDELRQAQTQPIFVSYLEHAAAQLASAKNSREIHVGVVLRNQYANVVVVYEMDLGDRILWEQVWWRVRAETTTLLDYRLEPKP